MLLSTEATVKLGAKNVNYYKKLGYDIPMKISKKDGKSLVADYSKPITVKVEDLSRGSRSLVDILCDYCKKEIMRIPYSAYIKSIKTINKNACEKCKFKKIPESFMD